MKLKSMLILVATITPAAAYGFNVEPFIFNSVKTTFYEKSLHALGKFRSHYAGPVHEKLTSIAEICARGGQCKNTKLSFIKYDESPLIAGVRWNDDPLDLIPGSEKGFLKRFRGGKKASDKKKDINHRYSMLSRSHFGDMQFLHSMANKDGEDVLDVIPRILLWAEFTYSIAIGKIDTDDYLADTLVGEYYPNGKGECDKQGNPTCVSNLFDPWGEYRRQGISIREIALGSLLHMVQDSFTKSHTNRDSEGRIVGFYSYVNQDDVLHSTEDGEPEWITKEKWPLLNPVSVSEKILRLYFEYKDDNKDNLEELLVFIKEIYRPAKITEKSGPGPYTKK